MVKTFCLLSREYFITNGEIFCSLSQNSVNSLEMEKIQGTSEARCHSTRSDPAVILHVNAVQNNSNKSSQRVTRVESTGCCFILCCVATVEN